MEAVTKTEAARTLKIEQVGKAILMWIKSKNSMRLTFERIVKIELKSLILAQDERWRHA